MIASRRFPRRSDSVTRARHFVSRAVASNPGSPAGRMAAETAALLTSELATNAVLHGLAGFDVMIHQDDGMLRVGVTDEGDSPPGPGGEDSGPPSNRGLMVVDRLADHWGTTRHRGGKTVWFDLRLG